MSTTYDPLLLWSSGALSNNVFNVLAIAALEGEADHYIGQSRLFRDRRVACGQVKWTDVVTTLSPDYADYGIVSQSAVRRVAEIISSVMDQVAADAGSAYDESLDNFEETGLYDYAMFLLEGAARIREETS